MSRLYAPKETRTTNVFTSEQSEPLPDRLREKISSTEAEIVVGSSEKVPRGTLTCGVEDDVVVVRLIFKKPRKKPRPSAIELKYRPSDPSHLEKGVRLPEACFDKVTNWFVGTPWSSQSGYDIWTVACLRMNAEPVYRWEGDSQA